MFLKFSGFELKIILKSFLGVKGATPSENERNLFKSLLIFYFMIKQNKSGAED